MKIKTDNYEIYKGDCLEVMDKLIEQGVKVDAIITDPPYGTTACRWDSVIPFDEMWVRLNKLIKHNGAIVLFGSEPFSSHLRMSNLKNYRYDWVWKKSYSTGFMNANKMPLKNTENVMVFYKKLPTYNPQGVIEVNKIKTRKKDKSSTVYNDMGLKEGRYTQKFTNYPHHIIETFKKEKTVHPTQKPIPLLEYLIKTYSNKDDLILDFTMGSGSTGVACMLTDRKFIGIELDEKYFEIAENRLKEATEKKEELLKVFDKSN